MRLSFAKIQWDESDSPYSPLFEDIYHSRQGGVQESQHVFLHGNELAQRFSNLPQCTWVFKVGEIGFGSGLNFLLTWQLWQRLAADSHTLHYLAFEKFPLDAASLQRFYQQWPDLQPLAKQLLRALPGNCGGIHRLHLDKRVTLDLYLGDASTMFEAMFRYDRGSEAARPEPVHAWFLDGFSPKKNPDLWNTKLFEFIAASSGPETTLSSYTVASSAIKALQASGFCTEKTPGFGPKRHMLKAHYASTTPVIEPALNRKKSPWFLLPTRATGTRTALVIGAGLAGSSTAYSLARRGWKVQVVDKAEQLASGASGNSQAVLQCRLFQQQSPAAEFMLQSYLYALRLYQRPNLGKASQWHGCGVVQLSNALNKRKPLLIDALKQLYPDSIITRLAQTDSRILDNIDLSEPALWFPQGGWLNPSLLCQALLSHENIEVKLKTEITALESGSDGWTAISNSDSDTIDQAAAVIIATSHSAAHLSQAREIPLLRSRGQVTQIPSTSRSSKLSVVLSGTRFICPANAAQHMIGASYHSVDDSPSTNSLEQTIDSENLDTVKQLFLDPEFLGQEIIGARVSVRCNAPDRMPVVGMVPKHLDNLNQYRDLAKNAQRVSDISGSYHAGLFINVAHGSFGLSSCPLSAEYLASLINNEQCPLTSAQADCLNPIRFLIRDLKKQRIG